MARTTQTTTIDDEPAAGAPTAPPKAEELEGKRGSGVDLHLSGKKFTVNIAVSREEDGKDAVPVGINGYVWQIPRGKPVIVPEEVVEVLKNATMTTFSSAQGGGEVPIDSPRYSFQAWPVAQAA